MSYEERFPEDPSDCSHEKTRTKITTGMNTEVCHDCGKSWTPPRS